MVGAGGVAAGGAGGVEANEEATILGAGAGVGAGDGEGGGGGGEGEEATIETI